MHTSMFKFIPAALLASVALAGCAAQTPNLDQHFGDAVNAAKAQQTINPDASQNTELVTGVDGEVANDVIDRYHKSYKQPPATPNIFTIGVGTGGGGGGGTGSAAP